jgi:hypothetical protein
VYEHHHVDDVLIAVDSLFEIAAGSNETLMPRDPKRNNIVIGRISIVSLTE